MNLKNENIFSESPTTFILPNNGVVIHKLPSNIFNTLSNLVEDTIKNEDIQIKYNHALAGHILKEYSMDNHISIVKDYILRLVDFHRNNFELDNQLLPELKFKHNIKFDISSMWINFQKKYEFNPDHTHSGKYSFVIWMKIPYDMKEEEDKFPHMNKTTKSPGAFNISYTDILGTLRQYHFILEKSSEGYICLFPSNLTHSVHPFYTSDDYRISIAGNISLDIEKCD